ncbi:hypothetical protein RB595_010460 [Gaeumannomyces hyphopodioides]
MQEPLDLLADSWEVDAQADSPLFNGTIPVEIRFEIFRHALTPSTVIFNREKGYVPDPAFYMDSFWEHNFREQTGHDDNVDSDLPDNLDELPEITTGLSVCRNDELSWCRPGWRGRPVLSINLLASCRRAFFEARQICFQIERCWWWWTGPWHPFNLRGGMVNFGYKPEKRWYPPGIAGRPLDSWPLERVEWEQRFRSARIFGHPGFPSDDYLLGHRHPPPFLKLQHLRITIPKSGMDGCFAREMMVINPFGAQSGMEAAMRISKDFTLERALKRGGDGCPTGRPAWMPPGLGFELLESDAEFQGPWGRKFVNLPELRTLTIDFDIDQYRRKKMDAIVEWAARVWQLPLNPNINGGYHYLSADGNPIEKMTWRGSYIHRACPCGCNLRCQTFLYGDIGDGWNNGNISREEGKELDRIRFKGFGARMYTWTVTWTRRRYDGPEIYPYNGAIGVREDDLRGAVYEEGNSDEPPAVSGSH